MLARWVLRGERLSLRCLLYARAALIRGAFRAFGDRTRLHPSVRINHPERISIGAGVWVGAGAWLHVVPGPGDAVAIEIGDGCSLAGNCTLAAVERVVLGRDVLIARGVYISDHSHAFGDADVPILRQGVDRIGAVEIGDGAWLAENAVICPGVTIGRGAVVGANSVVTRDVPARSVVVGAPARVVRTLDSEAERVAA